MLRQQAASDAGSYCLGPAFTAQEIKQVLENCKLRFRSLRHRPEIIDAAVDQLEENRIVAWMQGRMEFGPRALGNRSILASPQDPLLHRKSQHVHQAPRSRPQVRGLGAGRTGFGVFRIPARTPAISPPSASVRPEYKEQFRGAILPSDLIRVHTVSKEDNPLYWQLLHAFGEKTGLPVLYNTSFNLFGEPLVCTPRDAVRSFYSSGIDAMVVGQLPPGKVSQARRIEEGASRRGRPGRGRNYAQPGCGLFP